MARIVVDVTGRCSFEPANGSQVSQTQELKVSHYDSTNGVYVNKNFPINVYPRSEFNQPYNISDDVEDCSNLFNQCSKFNQLVTIGDNVKNTASMFNGCSRFDQSITIPQKVTNTYKMFGYCTDYSKSVVIPDNVVDASYMFYNCHTYFNNAVTIGANVRNASAMFSGCRSLNRQSFTLHDNIVDASYMFDNCDMYQTSGIPLGNGITNAYAMYRNTRINGYDVNLPYGITDIRSMFESCGFLNPYNFNIPNTVTNLDGVLLNCDIFNANLYFASSSRLTTISNLISKSRRFTKSISIPNNVSRIYRLVDQCTMFGGTVWLSRMLQPLNLSGMFYSASSIGDSTSSGFLINIQNFSHEITCGDGLFVYCSSFRVNLNINSVYFNYRSKTLFNNCSSFYLTDFKINNVGYLFDDDGQSPIFKNCRQIHINNFNSNNYCWYNNTFVNCNFIYINNLNINNRYGGDSGFTKNAFYSCNNIIIDNFNLNQYDIIIESNCFNCDNLKINNFKIENYQGSLSYIFGSFSSGFSGFRQISNFYFYGDDDVHLEGMLSNVNYPINIYLYGNGKRFDQFINNKSSSVRINIHYKYLEGYGTDSFEDILYRESVAYDQASSSPRCYYNTQYNIYLYPDL